MIAQLKATKGVKIDIFDPNAPEVFLIAEITNWNKSVTDFTAQGQYYYEKVETPEVLYENGEVFQKAVITKVPVRNIHKTISNSNCDALFTSLNIQYPEGTKYSEKGNIEVQAGLSYIVKSEGYWGLTPNDWE